MCNMKIYRDMYCCGGSSPAGRAAFLPVAAGRRQEAGKRGVRRDHHVTKRQLTGRPAGREEGRGSCSSGRRKKILLYLSETL